MLIVRVAGDENIVLRLRAELSSYRFRVIEQQAAARRSKELSDLAEERDAQAALRAKPEAMAVELWVRAGGRTSEELVNAGPGRNPEVLALRVTEAMRARGLELPPLVAAASVRAGSSRRAGPGAAADSSKPGATDSSTRPGRTAADASTPDSDDPGVAEPTTPPPAATPIVPPAKIGEPEMEPERPSVESQPPKAPAPDRKLSEPTERKAPDSPERKAAEAAERRSQDAERKLAEATERQAADAERKAAEAAARKAAEAERKAAEAAKRKAAETAAKPADAADEQTPSEPEPEPEPENTTLREALVYAEVGPNAVWSPGNNRVGPTLDAMISLRFRPYQTSSISLVGLIPLLTTELQTADGATVDVRTYAIGGFGDLHLPLGRVELSAGLGALALLSSVMVSSPEYISDYKTQRLAALLGRAAASYAITRDLRVSGSLMAGLTVAPLQLEFPRVAGDRVSSPTVTWGRPLLLGSLSIELALPWDR